MKDSDWNNHVCSCTCLALSCLKHDQSVLQCLNRSKGGQLLHRRGEPDNEQVRHRRAAQHLVHALTRSYLLIPICAFLSQKQSNVTQTSTVNRTRSSLEIRAEVFAGIEDLLSTQPITSMQHSPFPRSLTCQLITATIYWPRPALMPKSK